MTEIDTSEGSGCAGYIHPQWFTDGETLTIELVGFAEYAGRTVTAQVYGIDAIAKEFRLGIGVLLDEDGNGSVAHEPGLQFGTHAAAWVAAIQIQEGDPAFPTFTNVMFSHMVESIANSPAPGEDLAAAHEQLSNILQAQEDLYATPLGDPDGPDVIEHRALCVLEGLLLASELRVPGGLVRAIDDRPTDADRMEIINGQLALLGWPTKVPRDRWAAESAARSPMAAIVCPQIWASDFEDAARQVGDLQEKLTGILALNRRATGRLVGLVVEQREEDGVKWRVYPTGGHYEGNLLGGELAGEDQRSLLAQFQGADADPLVRLCCDLYGESLAERSPDARYLRLWSILEFLSGARLPDGQAVIRRDGSSWPGNANTTSFAAPRVYAYLNQMITNQPVDEASFVAPAPDLYELVRACYGRRNATGHYGRLVIGDSMQNGQGWYQWAVKTSVDEAGWLRALARMVEMCIHTELFAAAP